MLYPFVKVISRKVLFEFFSAYVSASYHAYPMKFILKVLKLNISLLISCPMLSMQYCIFNLLYINLCRFGDWAIPQTQDYCFQHPEAVDRTGPDDSLYTEHISTTGYLALDHHSCCRPWYAPIWTGGSQCQVSLDMINQTFNMALQYVYIGTVIIYISYVCSKYLFIHMNFILLRSTSIFYPTNIRI